MSNGNPDRDTWLTPPYIIRALGEFDVDPCCPPMMPWTTATRMLTITDDGLHSPWSGRVWLNPPYSESEPWLKRMAAHSNGVSLLQAGTETDVFHDYVWPTASAIFFLHGRLQFFTAEGRRSFLPARFSSVLVAYDPHDSHVNAYCTPPLGKGG